MAAFTGSMPTGVTALKYRRIFVNFPHWGNPVPFSVAEINKLDKVNPKKMFVSVQLNLVDPRNRLRLLDTGSIKLMLVIPGGPKSV